MGDFHLDYEFTWAGSTWVRWDTPVGTKVYVLLRNNKGEERCIRHFANADQFDEARGVFDTHIGPKIDLDVEPGSKPRMWVDVTMHYHPDESKRSWTYVLSWDGRGGGALIVYHINPPGYQYDEPFVGSQRHRDWWDQDTSGADLRWPVR